MAKFALLFKGGSPNDTTRKDMVDRWGQWMRELKERNIFIEGAPFKKEGKKIVGTEKEVSDHMENSDDIGGYLFINAVSLDEATEIALNSPNLILDGKVHVVEIDNM